MADINDGGCAFPATEKQADGSHWHSHMGMSLRDYLAGQVLPSLAEGMGPKLAAQQAYQYADAMIAARAAPAGAQGE
jgi:hypothetical protein